MTKRILDIIKKTTPLLLFSICIYLYTITDALTSTYLSGDNYNSFKIYSGVSPSLNVFLTMVAFYLIYLFIGFIEESKYNNTKIEKRLFEVINKRPRKEINTYFYGFILLSLPSLVFYQIIKSLFQMVLSTNLTVEYDYFTYEQLPNYGMYDNTLSIVAIMFLFMFFVFAKPKKEINFNLIVGAYFVPVILLSLFKIGISAPEGMKEFGLNITNIIGIQEGLNTLLFFVCIAFTLRYTLALCFEKKDLKSKFKDLFFVAGGYLFNKALTFVFMLLALMGSEANYLSAGINDKTVNLNGTEYNINVSLLTHKDNKGKPFGSETEWLIESYFGLSMHNAQYALQYLFGDDFKGDKERSYLMFAKIYKQNSILMEAKKDKMLNAMNTGVNMTDAVSTMIPLIIYEASPYENMKRSIDSVIKKDYQGAVDYYISDQLNSKTKRKSSFDGREIGQSVGYPVYVAMLSSIVQNGYAKIDYSKIENEELRERIKEEFTSPIFSGEDIPIEIVEKWFDMFEV